MHDFEELFSLDATALAALIRKKDVSPKEVTTAAIERIERLNPRLNAVVTPMFDRALARAGDGPPDGPFYGVPFLLKDLLAEYGGVRLTEGCRYLGGYTPDEDSEIVARYKRSGLVILGKTNTPEFGLVPTTEPVLFGPTRNPWDTNRTPGGSSGGSAAAVADRMVPLAHGNDGGGSIRIPASCCGLFGLKPTRGRITMAPGLGDMAAGLGVEHGLTRSVRDSALLLDVTAGPAPGDPYFAAPPARPFIEEVGAPPGRLRIAVSWDTAFDSPVHPDCVRAVRETADLLAELGHEPEQAHPQYDARALAKAYSVLWSSTCVWTVEYWRKRIGLPDPGPEMFEPFTWAMYQRGLSRTAGEYLLAITEIQRVSRQVAAFFETYDLWLTPTLAEPPLTLGLMGSTPEDPLAGGLRAAAFAPFTALCNATGQPAMSVPLFQTADGLPVGSQFMARYGDEAALFRLAAQLEEARPWADKKPPLE